MIERIVFHSFLGGLTALIPFPWVDDWVGNRVRRGMVKELFRRRGIPLREPALSALVPGGAGTAGGCLYQAFFGVVVLPVRLISWVFRGLLRTLLLVFAAKQAADRMSRTFHEGYLLDAALRQGWIGPSLSPEQALRVRAACDYTLAEVDMSPVTSVFRQVLKLNRSTFVRAAGVWHRLARTASRQKDVAEPDLEPESRLLERVIAATGDLLGGQAHYLAGLERKFGHHLVAAGALTLETPPAAPVVSGDLDSPSSPSAGSDNPA